MSYRFCSCLHSISFPLASSHRTRMTYTWCCMYSLRLWWWTERLSKTCRVLFQNKINLRYCASGWFYYRNFSSSYIPLRPHLCCKYWYQYLMFSFVFFFLSCYVLDFACRKDLLLSQSFNRQANTNVQGTYTSNTSIFSRQRLLNF